MRIVHAVYGMDMGGMEVLVAQLCRDQRARGHQVSVFAYSSLGVLGKQLVDEGFEVYVPEQAHPLRTIFRYLSRFRSRKPDVVHCHGVAPTIQAAIAAKIARVPVILSTRHRVEFFPYDRASERQYNLVCWLCSWITGICQTTCNQLRAGPWARKDRIVTVYNGMQAVPRSDYSALGKSGFTVLFVGRLMPEKGLDTLIRAVALASVKLPAIKLWIVGDGRMRRELEELVQQLGADTHVIFWGQHVDTAPFFSGADVFTMSSINEGLPLSLLQAMSLGTPAVTTDVDGMGEVLRLTGGGLLVPPKDPEAFAEALLTLALDKNMHAACSAKARKGFEDHFTFERMAANYMTLYEGGTVGS